MSRILIVSALSASVLLSACGNNETPEQPSATQPAQTATENDGPPPLPAASVSDIPQQWTGADLVSSEFISATVDGTSAVLSRIAAGEDNSSFKTSGAHVEYLLPLTAGLNTQLLEVTVTASSATDANAPFTVAYSTNLIGNSGWREFEATGEAQEFSFVYKIADRRDTNEDYIGISVPEGSSIRVDEIKLAVAE